METKKIIIKPGCISCGLCAYIAPELFEVTDTSHIKQNADFTRYESQLKSAISQCPVQVICYEKEPNHDTTKTE